MTHIVTSFQLSTPTRVGEEGHAEKAWSFDIDEKITQFFFQLVRSKDHSDLERHLHDILGKLKYDVAACGMHTTTLKYLITMYKLIGQTRDIISGKGEQQLSFMQIFIWWNYFPELAFNALVHFVKGHEHPYGSWKDIKYFAKYIKDKTANSHHPLIIHACKLICGQINEDWELYTNKECHISLAAKWCPREPNYSKKKNIKFGFIYQIIADEMFPQYFSSVHPYLVASWNKAKLKCKITLKKRLVILNKHLNTVQIKQCANEWDTIDFNAVSTQTLRRQTRAFQNLTKLNLQKSEKIDRIQCAQNFKDHIDSAKIDPSLNRVHGKRCNKYELVKDAMNYPHRTSETATNIDAINLQWNDHCKNNKDLGNIPIVAMIDTSCSMEYDNSIPLYNSIGLGIRCSELKIGRASCRERV